MVGELHCHTRLSRPRAAHLPLPTPEELVDYAISIGLDFIAITDHDDQEAFVEVNEYALNKGLVVIPAVEVNTKPTPFLRRRAHILCYGVTDIIEPYISVNATIDAVHAQNGIAVAAHPFCSKFAKVLYIGHQVGDYDFDGLEVFNSAELDEDNAKSESMATILGFKHFAGSDAHGFRNMGQARVNVDIPHTKKWEDIVDALKKGKFSIIQRNKAVKSVKQTLLGRRFRQWFPI